MGPPAMAPILYKMYLVYRSFGKSVAPSGERHLPEDNIPQMREGWETIIS